MVQTSYRVPAWCLNTTTKRYGSTRPNPLIGIVTSFDNTPRREKNKAKIWMPRERGEEIRIETFQKSLQAVLHFQACCHTTQGGTDRFVLINAWNEWGEGMALEPSYVYQLKFLEALKETKENLQSALYPYLQMKRGDVHQSR